MPFIGIALVLFGVSIEVPRERPAWMGPDEACGDTRLIVFKLNIGVIGQATIYGLVIESISNISPTKEHPVTGFGGGRNVTELTVMQA